MSMYKYDAGGGFSGQSYDKHVFEENLSTVNKLQREYWTAKQVLKKKFGKEQDHHLFKSIQTTCADLMKEIDNYQQHICNISSDENQLGRFLKEQGTNDKTKAGKMMIAVGKSLCYTAQQRINLRNPLGRLHQDVETFRYRAISDSLMSVDQMEEARTHYRASLLWMQDISANLDPEQYKKLEKFRKVQNEVRMNREKFDRQKWAVCQKVDLLCASRSNLFSNTLVPYQEESLKFWDKTSRALSAVLESFNGYQHYEFKLLKKILGERSMIYTPKRPKYKNRFRLSRGLTINVNTPPIEEIVSLNPIQDIDLPTTEKTEGETDENTLIDWGDDENETPTDNLDQLNQATEAITLNKDEDGTCLITFDESESVEAADDRYIDIKLQDKIISEQNNFNPADKNIDLLGGLTTADTEQAANDDLLNEILGGDNNTEAPSDLEQQWQSVFGNFEDNTPQQEETTPANLPSADLLQSDMQHPAGGSGYLPSQLMDFNFLSNQQQITQGQIPTIPGQFPQGQAMMQGVGQFPQPPMYNSLYTQQQPGMPQNVGQPTNMMTQMTAASKSQDGKAAWYNLFAELDPLQNPDELGGKNTNKKEKQAC